MSNQMSNHNNTPLDTQHIDTQHIDALNNILANLPAMLHNSSLPRIANTVYRRFPVNTSLFTNTCPKKQRKHCVQLATRIVACCEHILSNWHYLHVYYMSGQYTGNRYRFTNLSEEATHNIIPFPTVTKAMISSISNTLRVEVNDIAKAGINSKELLGDIRTLQAATGRIYPILLNNSVDRIRVIRNYFLNVVANHTSASHDIYPPYVISNARHILRSTHITLGRPLSNIINSSNTHFKKFVAEQSGLFTPQFVATNGYLNADYPTLTDCNTFIRYIHENVMQRFIPVSTGIYE